MIEVWSKMIKRIRKRQLKALRNRDQGAAGSGQEIVLILRLRFFTNISTSAFTNPVKNVELSKKEGMSVAQLLWFVEPGKSNKIPIFNSLFFYFFLYFL